MRREVVAPGTVQSTLEILETVKKGDGSESTARTIISIPAVEKMDVNLSSEVSSIPVENYKTFIDSIKSNPAKVSLSVIMRASDYHKLEKIRSGRHLVNFCFNKWSWKRFDNFVVNSINISEGVEYSNTFPVDIVLTEVGTFDFLDVKQLTSDGHEMKSPQTKSTGETSPPPGSKEPPVMSEKGGWSTFWDGFFDVLNGAYGKESNNGFTDTGGLN